MSFDGHALWAGNGGIPGGGSLVCVWRRRGLVYWPSRSSYANSLPRAEGALSRAVSFDGHALWAGNEEIPGGDL